MANRAQVADQIVRLFVAAGLLFSASGFIVPVNRAAQSETTSPGVPDAAAGIGAAAQSVVAPAESAAALRLL